MNGAALLVLLLGQAAAAPELFQVRLDTSKGAIVLEIHNLRDNSPTHDKEPFVPFGRVVRGMDVADALYSDYGETSGGGIRAGRQGPLFEGGNASLEREFPKLDFIVRASIAR